MKKLIILSCVLGLSIASKAQNNYDSAKISANLQQNAIAVIRNEEQFFDFKSPGSGELTYKVAITILNKAGDDFAELAEQYDKFSMISNVKATIYDASGKKIKDYKSSDIRDQSLISNFSIFEDNRIKLLQFISNSYPYTIEYSYTQDFKGVISLPSWRSIKGFGVSTEKSTYTIQKNTGTTLKFITSKDLKTDSTKVGDKMLYKWTCANVAAIESEPLSVDMESISDWVKASPNQFEYDNTTGNFDNWKNFGAWINKLNENSNTLPAPVVTKVQDLIKGLTTPKEKISVLYNYLQQNTRYVSVQLGIGGFKPIVAEKVAQVNYGDCKALSNYMKALLNEAGIKANLIVIGNGMPSLNPNYSSMGQANHMIVCVPLANDTTFLECTSQHHPMGYIGNSNAGRNVLMITADGGKIVQTPTYASQDNSQVRNTRVNFKDDGTADILMKSTYANAQYENYLGILLSEPTEQQKFINENIDIPGAELITFKYEQANKALPILTEEINLRTPQLLVKGGDKAFLVLNIINRRESVPIKLENRKTPFAVSFSYKDEDEINFTLPKGFAIEFLPKDIVLSSEFGTYTAKFIAKDNTITYQRKQVVTAKKFPPEKYNEYVEFTKKIFQADKQKAVLAKTI